MRTRCVVHFQPLEKYPPAINLLRELAKTGEHVQTHVFTSFPEAKRNKINIPGIFIHRVVAGDMSVGKLRRILIYIKFILVTLFKIIRLKPETLLYYETLSAGAPCIYKKWINSGTSLFVHYHEYTSPGEYAEGMVLNRWLHKMERTVYKNACWISHTNADRMELFLSDIGQTNGKLNTHILPNYPPRSWSGYSKQYEFLKKRRVGIVYVGALSQETLYVKEFSDWVTAHQEECFWDIYSDNYTIEAKKYLDSLNSTNISFKGSVEYDQLPEKLSQYDVGVILYRGHIPNYIFNVPNKFFEYYNCGLDVWFPDHMKSSCELTTSNTYPQVKALDFSELKAISMQNLLDRSGMKFFKRDFTSENVYEKLISKFNKPQKR